MDVESCVVLFEGGRSMLVNCEVPQVPSPKVGTISCAPGGIDGNDAV